MTMTTVSQCPVCNGDGWLSEAAHACGGDERICAIRCPVEEQVQCPTCLGSGEIYLEVDEQGNPI